MSRPTARSRCWMSLLPFTFGLGAWAASEAQPIPKAVTALRVCADPNNLPFSNRAEQGFENKIAALLGRELGLPVRYTWHPQGQGFVRKTLGAGSCDVIIGVPSDYGPVRTTKPYYRSTYAFVYRTDRQLTLKSLDDAALRRVNIGVQTIGDDYQNTPPAQALAARGIIDNVAGFPIFANYANPNPEARIIDAVVGRQIDVAIVWAPLGGYFAARSPVSLTVVPLPSAMDASGTQFAFDIAMGARRADTLLISILDRLLERQRPAIERILGEYNVPIMHPIVHP
jgi:mxaJ protein